MKAEIFVLKYADKATAAIVFKKIKDLEQEDENIVSDLGILACSLERIRSTSKRARSLIRINVVLTKEKSQNLPTILKGIHSTLQDHPLFNYLSFDYTACAMTSTEWNFNSYDDPKYQKIFIQKRLHG